MIRRGTDTSSRRPRPPPCFQVDKIEHGQDLKTTSPLQPTRVLPTKGVRRTSIPPQILCNYNSLGTIRFNLLPLPPLRMLCQLQAGLDRLVEFIGPIGCDSRSEGDARSVCSVGHSACGI